MSPYKNEDANQIEFDAHPDSDEFDTDRQEFYNLDSDRKLKEVINQYKNHRRDEVEMRNFGSTSTRRKKSLDTKATERQEGIIIPDVSAESLIGV